VAALAVTAALTGCASAGATTPAASATPTTRPPAGPNNPGGRTPSPTPSTPSATPTTVDPCGPVRRVIDVANTEQLDPSMCFHIGGVLRLQNVEPGAVTAEPEELRSMGYEVGGYEMQFLRAGTVTVMVAKGDSVHQITVMVVE